MIVKYEDLTVTGLVIMLKNILSLVTGTMFDSFSSCNTHKSNHTAV